MRTGVMATQINEGTIDDVVGEVRQAESDGFDAYWSSQIFSHDALTALAVAGREVPRIELGTAVVPTYPRHPMAMAQQALTVNAATGGRLCLGIGLSHKIVIENMMGMSFDKPVRHLREYLSVLGPLLHGRAGRFRRRRLPGERCGHDRRGDGAVRRRRRTRSADAQGRRGARRRHAHVVRRTDDADRADDPHHQRRGGRGWSTIATGDRRTASVRHRRLRRRPRAGCRGVRRSTASCRATGPCSIGRVSTARPTSPSSVAPSR